MKKILSVMLAAMLLLSLAMTTASAANFPSKPIQIICPVRAGGDTDRNTRQLAIALEKVLGVSVAVVNVNGGATVLGMQQALDAEPDGYTLIINGTDMFVPNMMGTTDITLSSFKTIGVPLIDNTTVLVAHKDSGYADLKDLVEKTKAAPDTIEYGGKIGATNQICGIAMNQEWEAAFRFQDVGNNAAKITALLGRQTDVINLSYSLALDYFKTGEFQALCLLGSEPNELIPDAKLASEYGYKNVDFSKFFWVGVNPDTPDEIVDILADALAKAAQDPDFLAYLEANFLTPANMVKEEAQEYCQKFYEETMEIYKEAFVAAQ